MRLTGTVLLAVLNDNLGIARAGASLVGAVTDTVAEVGVLAQARGGGRWAAQRCRLAEHVVDTCLLNEACQWAVVKALGIGAQLTPH